MTAADENIDVITEFVRRTAEAQGLPAELEDVTVARRVAALIVDEARSAHDAEQVA